MTILFILVVLQPKFDKWCIMTKLLISVPVPVPGSVSVPVRVRVCACARARVRACARACVRACVCACVRARLSLSLSLSLLPPSLSLSFPPSLPPWSEPASELLVYRPSDSRLSEKWLPTFADRGCHVVSVTASLVSAAAVIPSPIAYMWQGI
jgi:hypothetical protein